MSALSIRLLVVIPAYNAAQTVGEVVSGLAAFQHDVLVVDDGSRDGTAEAASRAGARVVRLERNQGKGRALQRGFDLAVREGFDAVATLDADGQHAPDELPRFLDAFRNGARVAVGNRMRHPGEMPLLRRLTNRFMSRLLSRLAGQPIPDTQNGFRLYAAEIIREVRTRSGGFAAESEMLLRIAARGIPIASVPVSSLYRSEHSAIQPCIDTLHFFRMLREFRKESKI